MELLSGDVPAGPGTLTNSNQARQSEFSKEKSQSFKYSFITFYYLLGLIGFMITVLNLLYRFPIGAHLSPVCPGLKNLKNLYEQNFSFDLHVFISENETNLVQKSELVWKKAELAYGDLGKVYGFSTNLSISEPIQDGSSLYLHVCLSQSGFPLAPRKGDYWAELYAFCKTKRLNFYQEANGAQSTQVRSFWRPNWTVNLVGDGGLGFEGKEDGRIDCDPLTGKHYPLLYINDNFNLARDCIAIDQTIESLPLNLVFKQIDIHKLRDYMRQNEFEEYFRRSDRLNEEFIRRNLIASDFKKTGLFHIDHFWAILVVLFLIKCVIFSLTSFVPLTVPLTVLAMLVNSFFMALLPVASFLFVRCYPKEEETVKSGDTLGANESESSIKIPVKHLKFSDKIETDPGFLQNFLLNFLRLEWLVILRNLVVFLLVPLPFLYLSFSLSLCHVAFSSQENLVIFTLLALYNCHFYLVSIYWNSGRLFFFDLPVPAEDFSESMMYMNALQISACFHGQLMALWAVLILFPLAGFSTPAFLLFTFASLLSDLKC